MPPNLLRFPSKLKRRMVNLKMKLRRKLALPGTLLQLKASVSLRYNMKEDHVPAVMNVLGARRRARDLLVTNAPSAGRDWPLVSNDSLVGVVPWRQTIPADLLMSKMFQLSHKFHLSALYSQAVTPF